MSQSNIILNLFALSVSCMLLSGWAQGAQRQTAFYVAPQGNDAWSGTLADPNATNTDGPFATLTRARDEIRRRKDAGGLSGPVNVFVRGGLYSLTEPFRLETRDSGTAEAPIAYRAQQGEQPVVMGGKAITRFVPHAGKILKADLGAQGLKGANFRQLLYNGRRAPLARYPNFDPLNPYGGGWAYADGAPVPMYKDVPGEDNHTLHYKEQDARSWATPEEGEVFVFPRYNWWNNIVRIKSVDRKNRRITLAGECSYPIRPTDRYYVQGLFEELDAPGEWWLDRRSGTLYFWPPDGVEPKDVTAYAPTIRTIVEIAGASYVTLRGFTFECCAGTAIAVTNAANCLIAGNTIRGVGDYDGSGVSVEGGENNRVAGNDIYDVGRDAVFLSGGDRATLTPAGNCAENNYLHHVGVCYKQGVGVSLQGCGNRASHNLIHDGPRWGIGFAGNNLVVEYNHIRHVNLETADTGAVYTGGRDWLGARGAAIRYNYFHDILGFGQENGRWVSPHYAWGVYLDDNTGGVDVIGNVVARCVRGLIHLHNGRDNLVENNIFIDGKLQQIECNGWTRDSRPWKDHLPTMIKGFESVAGQPAWKKMRNMHIHPNDAPGPDGLIMSGNVFRRNICFYADPESRLLQLRRFPFDRNEFDYNLYWHGGRPVSIPQEGVEADAEWTAWRSRGQDAHSLLADPLFLDAAHDDYRLKPESPAFQLGFQPIPVERIGPYQDPLRASWPILEASGAREHMKIDMMRNPPELKHSPSRN